MGKLSWSSFNAGAPTKGGDHSVPQHKAAAMGYSVANDGTSTKTNQKSGSTGCSHVPGLVGSKR